ncbi:hypothetical protein [Citreimonas salinaria]|uniref:NADH dehydrogenase n=1 Tax=Citreimonas salinaria TaxID=321339 RepID=A0A1H3GX22_9RHOB|nr:hypothetical protein [Citreimonas salinaria]SDY07620.1 hypothetical protein SAMN05444340_10387 [Citreimonas salinaria]
MKKLLALAALPVIAACAMPPRGVSDENLAAFDAAVASIGCDLASDADYQAVGLQTGIGRAKLAEIAEYRVATDEAVRLSNGGVRLVTGACAPVPEAPVAAEAPPVP